MNPRSAQRLSKSVCGRTARVRNLPDRVVHHLSNLFTRRAFSLSAVLSLIACVALAAGAGVKPVPYDRMAAAGQEPALTKTVLHPAGGWVNSKVFVASGDIVNVTADGLVDPGVRLRRGPDGEGQDALKEMTRECPYMSLIGRIGDGPVFCVGSNSTFEVIEGGQLSFHVNELDALRFDDQGSFHIEVRVVSPGKEDPKARKLVAVLPLVAVNLTPEQAQGVNVALRGRLARANTYTLIDKAQVDRALTGVNPASLTSVDAARSVGRTVGAQQVIFGQVNRIAENRYTLTLQRASVDSGKVEKTMVETIECLPANLPAQVAALAENI